MLITVSGIVGSGKTTAATRVAEALREHGVEATVVRFQSLPCFRLPSPSRRSAGAPGPAHEGETSERRGVGYRQRPLSAPLAAGYVARVIAFRAYSVRWPSSNAHILNRYFYDNFVHLQLRTFRERAYYSLLRRLVPAPDLALHVVSDLPTLASRRPNYSMEYLAVLNEAYRGRLPEFPGVVELRTDAPCTAEGLPDWLRERLLVMAARQR